MERRHIFSACLIANLVRSRYSINKRFFRSSLLEFNKFNRNQISQKITIEYDQRKPQSDNSYYERNDNLLDLELVFKQIDRIYGYEKKIASNQIKNNDKKIKKHEKKKSDKTDLQLKCEFESDEKNDKSNEVDDEADVNKQFIDDVKPGNNYHLSNQVVLDGIKLINDVIYYDNPKIFRIYYSDYEKLCKINDVDELKENGVKFFKVSSHLMKKYSEVVDPQGVIAIAKLNLKNLFEINLKKNESQIPLILILNKIKDPGNIGTLVRTSFACGISKLLCMDGCAKLLRGKVIRSTAGAVFQVPFIEKLSVSDLEKYIPKNAKIFLSDSKGINVDENLIKLTKDADKDFSGIDDEDIVEGSLGEVHEKKDNDDKKPYDLAGNNDPYNIVEKSKKFMSLNKKSVDSNNIIGNSQGINVFNYLNVNYFTSPNDCVILIANGEIGLSDEILSFVQTRNCTKVHIPLANSVDSLNTSVAASIIMFEIKRQYFMNYKK